MKATRKLIPAIAMLLISAVMMSTASFAWFSTNTTASADGFKVQISSATTILIKDVAEDDSEYATTQTYSSTNLAMSPASANKPENATDGNIAVPVFYKVDSAGDILPSNGAFIAGTGSGKTSFVTTTTDYITQTVNLRATGDGTDLGKLNLTITALPSAAADSINESLRVMVAVKNGNNVTWYLYAPFGGTAIKPVIGYDASTGAQTTEEEVSLTANGATEIIAAVAPETEYTVTFYIWFEGQDPTCYANNAINLEDVELGFDFTIVPKNNA